MLQDERDSETNRRKQENLENAIINESIRSAPQMVLQKLNGFSNWLSWVKQGKEILSNISHDSSKVSIVILNHLYQHNDFGAVMKFLEQKYDCPDEIVSLVLAKGYVLTWAGTNRGIMKQNILSMQIIERPLKKLGMVRKVDSYYLSQLHVRVLVGRVR